MCLRAARFWVLAGVLVAVNVSGWLWLRHELLGRGRPRLRVLTALPARDVDDADRFSLVFDQPLAATDSVDKPVERAIFDITPRPGGHLAWAAPDRLEFRLANRLPPGRRYTIRPTSHLESQTGRILVGTAEFRFATRALELDDCRLQSGDEMNVAFELKFNQPVDPADALRHMTVRDAKTAASLEPVALVQKPSESLVFRALRPSSRRLAIVLDAALTGSGGELPLGEKIARELEVERGFALLYADVHRPSLTKDVTVVLRFSGPVAARQSAPKVQVRPPVQDLQVHVSSGSLVLEGPFECARAYAATVPAGVLSADGRVTSQEQRVAFEIPDRSPQVKIPFQHGILIPTGNLTTDLQTVNVAGVHLIASRVHANNSVAHLRGNHATATSRAVANRTVPLDQPHNEPTKLALDLRGLLGTPLGTYRVEASATNRNWVVDSAIVTVSDLGITAKQERAGHLVWITSLTTGKALAEVRVSAVSYNNQTLSTATTDATGLARLAVGQEHPDGPTWAILAECGDDLNYIVPNKSEWVLDDVDQSGRAIATSYDVMLYTERGVYRPGDTIHLTDIIRDTAGETPPAFPIAIRVTRPDGRVVATPAVTPAAGRQGTFHLDFPTREDGQTGSLARVEYEYEFEQVRGRTVWKSVERMFPIEKRVVEPQTPDAEIAAAEFTFPRDGAYRVRAVDRLSGDAARIDLRAVSLDSGSRAEMLNHPERLEITLDKESYTPGSVAKALVRSPFAGTLLVTLESDRILDQRVRELTESTAELEIPVPANLRGGAFVTATVVRPIDPAAKAWVPHRALGMARLVMNHAKNELPLTIIAPKQAEPTQTVSVTIHTGTPADAARPPLVHLWAVDEGVLLTTAYKTPNPFEHFFARRQAAVRTSDLYSDLLADFDRPASVMRIGGDGDSEAVDSMRSSLVPTRRRQAAVIWRTATSVGADGSAAVELELPRLTGEMRLMAVAVEGDRYAAARHAITLTSPLLVEASWPRFVAPGDRFRVPVKLFNATAGLLTVNLQVEPTGPIELDRGAIEQPVAVRPGEPTTIWLDAAATATGTADVRITAAVAAGSGSLMSATNEATFAVRPVTPLDAESRLLRIEAGQSLAIELSNRFLPGTTRTTLSISGRPTVQLLPALERLIDYPYGCVEQTTSRLIALLRVPELLGSDDAAAAAVRAMIDGGIVRLWSMQTRSGGLGYWPSAVQPSLWGSAYAAGFLLDARRAGHAVDERFVAELTAYLESSLEHASDAELDGNLRAQLCRLLAGYNRPQLGWMARLAERLDQLDMAGRAHLAGAWLEAGQRDRARTALPDDTVVLSVSAAATNATGRLTSNIEQQAVLLSVLLDLDKDNAWIPTLVRQLESARANGCWNNTLENATALAALARYQLTGPADAAFAGTVCTQEGHESSLSHASPALLRRLANDAFSVQISSRGAGPIFVTATTEGLSSADSFTAHDRQLRVRRRWTNSDGVEVDPADLRVGELIWVETNVTAPSLKSGETIANVAIVDALPGGMEVENPRLATSARPSDAASRGDAADRDDHADQPDRVEFLDDRVVLFTSVSSKPRVFRYLLRATSGSFAAPPVQASSMYDPSFASVHGSGRVEIRP